MATGVKVGCSVGLLTGLDGTGVKVGCGVGLLTGLDGTGVKVGCGVGLLIGLDGTGVKVGCGVGLLIGSVPPQASINTTAVANRSNRIILSFIQSYYPKRLLNGSTEGISYLEYVSVPKPGESC